VVELDAQIEELAPFQPRREAQEVEAQPLGPEVDFGPEVALELVPRASRGEDLPVNSSHLACTCKPEHGQSGGGGLAGPVRRPQGQPATGGQGVQGGRLVGRQFLTIGPAKRVGGECGRVFKPALALAGKAQAPAK